VKIFYCSGIEPYNLLLAVGIHLGRLPEGRIPTVAELSPIWKTPRWKRDERGIPVFLGADHGNNEVYALLLGTDPDMGLQTIYHLLNRAANPAQWKFYKIQAQIAPLARLGFFCASRLNLELIGSFLMERGFGAGYFDLVNHVRLIKEWNLRGKTESGRDYRR
jgi:hypothetical protein